VGLSGLAHVIAVWVRAGWQLGGVLPCYTSSEEGGDQMVCYLTSKSKLTLLFCYLISGLITMMKDQLCGVRSAIRKLKLYDVAGEIQKTSYCELE
jgi:hypothetical protein